MNQQYPYSGAPTPLFGGGNRNAPTPNMRDVETIPLGQMPGSYVPQGTSAADDVTKPLGGQSDITKPMIPFGVHQDTQPMPGPWNTPVKKKDLGPVTGWLVIVSGPGRGRSFEIGNGHNSVGRGPTNEVVLSNGDHGVSDVSHFLITYDELNREFYISMGNSRNIVYCNGAPVMNPIVLSSGSLIRVSSTMLVFVPFCGPNMDWVSSFPEETPNAVHTPNVKSEGGLGQTPVDIASPYGNPGMPAGGILHGSVNPQPMGFMPPGNAPNPQQ